MPKLKIAFLIDNFSIRAGFIKQVIEQANYFSKIGYDVTVFCSNYDKKNCFPEIKKNFKVITLNHKSNSYLFLPIQNRITKKRAMQKLILNTNSVFNVFIIHGDPYYMISKFILKNFPKAKIIWHVNDLPYSFDILFRKNVSVLFKILGPFLRFIDKYYISYFENITTLNNTNKLLIQKFFRKRSKVVFTGVDKFFQQKNKKRNLNQKIIKILTVGAFAINRRYEDIINATAKLNKKHSNNIFYLTIVGHQKSAKPYFRELTKLIKDLNMNKYVFFVSSATNSELKKEYSKADIFVQSTEHIGWTIPAMEAMVSEIPVIITDSCGLNEELRDEIDAFIVNSRSPDQIVRRIETLLDNDKFYRNIKRNGKNTILKKFMWTKYCLRYDEYLKKLKI